MVTILEYKPNISGNLEELINGIVNINSVINYGNSAIRYPGVYRECIMLNRPEAVRHTVNKMMMAHILNSSEAQDIIYYSPALIHTSDEVVVQKRIKHKGGVGTKILSSLPATYNTGDRRRKVYWEEYIPCISEWRVDVVEKRTSARLKSGGTGNIRSRKYGWIFEYPEIPKAGSHVRQAAIAAVKALELDFGAVDVGCREEGDLPVVYEVNSAPQLTSPTVTRWYAHAFAKYISNLSKSRSNCKNIVEVARGS